MIMDIQKALFLRKGDKVQCPTDRGEPAFIGTVKTETNLIMESKPITSYQGQQYIWIQIERTPGVPGGAWPSNRLTKV
jgi:hypothetical protein